MLTINGWSQPHDGLLELFPDAVPVEYTRHTNLDDFLYDLKMQHADAAHVVAWSLGAQLAAIAVARGVITPQKLVLVAPPFQFIANDAFPYAMSPDMYQLFHKNYVEDNARTVARFAALIGKGDAHGTEITRALSHHRDGEDITRWRPWLEHLGAFSAGDLDYNHFPSTLIIQGAQDAIVNPLHARHYARQIPGAEVWWLEHAGHASHLHDRAAFHHRVKGFLHG